MLPKEIKIKTLVRSYWVQELYFFSVDNIGYSSFWRNYQKEGSHNWYENWNKEKEFFCIEHGAIKGSERPTPHGWSGGSFGNENLTRLDRWWVDAIFDCEGRGKLSNET